MVKRFAEMSEQQALAYQMEHIQYALVEFSENYSINVQIMLVLMAIYR